MKHNQTVKRRKSGTGWFFGGWLGLSVASYVVLILLLVIADVWFVLAELSDDKTLSDLVNVPELWTSVRLTFLTCTAAAILAVLVAVPIGYCLSRFRFFGRSVIEAVLDIPVVLPPLVIGLSLLILFNNFPPKALSESMKSIEYYLNQVGIEVTHTKLAIVVAQFTVAAAFAVRTMKATFDQIDSRSENVAMALGASRGRAFVDIVLPQSYRGVVASGTLAWARALGEFGPILVFAGVTRGKTEVLSTSVYLEINTGNIAGAVIISLLMIILAMITILTVRLITERGSHD